MFSGFADDLLSDHSTRASRHALVVQESPHSGPLKSDVIMTRQKHLENRIGARIGQTGDRYATARHCLLAKAAPPAVASHTGVHPPGNVPATKALRVLLTAEVRADGTAHRAGSYRPSKDRSSAGENQTFLAFQMPTSSKWMAGPVTVKWKLALVS